MKKLIGHCGVDSGGLIIVDPCYLSEWIDGDYGEDNSYTKACKARDNKNNKEVLIAGIAGKGVSFTSGYGDGNYPVYAHFNSDKRITKVEIIME